MYRIGEEERTESEDGGVLWMLRYVCALRCEMLNHNA
jgi:hypothetical protein